MIQEDLKLKVAVQHLNLAMELTEVQRCLHHWLQRLSSFPSAFLPLVLPGLLFLFLHLVVIETLEPDERGLDLGKWDLNLKASTEWT